MQECQDQERWTGLGLGEFPAPQGTQFIIFCVPVAKSVTMLDPPLYFKGRWSLHKSDIRHGRWTACGLTRHFGQHHQGNIEEAIGNLRVTLVDRLTGPHSEENLLRLEQTWMHRLGTTETGWS